jgi:hypothetical protein
MLAVIGVLHAVCLSVYPKDELDVFRISDFYPLSVFRFCLPNTAELAIAGLYLLVFRLFWEGLKGSAHLGHLFLAGLTLLILSNLLHGWRYGIDYPTATWGDSGIEYYNDALVVKGPLWLLQRYNAVQSVLLEHSRTHPPGPVLLYYCLHRVLSDPGLISIAVAALFLGLSLSPLRRQLTLAFGAPPPGILLLYCILPAVLIYGLATADAIIAGLFGAAVSAFVDDERPWTWLAGAFWLSLAGFFTFGALFLIPVMAGFELLRRRRLRRSLAVIGLAVIVLAALKPLCGYDWWASFKLASKLENPKGFLLFADPRRYVWYRPGAVAEIAFFFTPFLGALMVRGRRALRSASPDFATLAWLGPATLGAMLLSGAMKIGEAARICVFILPFLLLPVAAAWRALDQSSRDRTAWAVFLWGLGMQLFGFYQW